jgi:hypothetical protein
MRVDLSPELLRRLEQQKRRARHDMITLDESWFYFCTVHELIWLAQRDKNPRERAPHVSVAKNDGHNRLEYDRVPCSRGSAKFNATSYATEILQHTLEWRRTGGTGRARRLMVHTDKARPQTARSSIDFLEANDLRRAPHPPYSPDLTPPDFYLLRDLSRRLSGFWVGLKTQL